MNDQQYLIIDYETFSEIDLKKVGAYKYASDPTTEILCVAWRVGTKEELLLTDISIWSPSMNGPSPISDLLLALFDKKIVLVAHNAFFEQVITKFVLSKLADKIAYAVQIPKALRDIPVSRWYCTAAGSRAIAIPGNLEGAALALNLPVKKDMEGRRLIMKMCKPRKPTKKDPSTRHNKPEDIHRLMQYCKTDVEAETHLFLTLPPLHPTERKVWDLDQAINFRGFGVDVPLVEEILDLITKEINELNRETEELTNGEIKTTNRRAAAIDWINDNGYYMPDLKAGTVRETLESEIGNPKVRRLLEIRQSVSRTSTAKYEAFRMRANQDGRIRDHLIFHVASTGRWGGSGVQPQNLPRGTISDIILAAEMIKIYDLETLRMLYGDPMALFSSCLRAMIIPSANEDFVCADYASIETRVLFWMAEHEDGLEAFRDNRPLYEEMAMRIFRVLLEEVTKEMRQVGKQAILGCGYGMGGAKFHATCLAYGIEISETLAQAAVDAYRATHSLIPTMWTNIQKAAIVAVQKPGKAFTINKTKWFLKPIGDQPFLWCELPSGRRLAYANPVVKYEERWQRKIPVLYHHSVNPLSRKWEQGHTYGGKLVENVVQAVSRDIMAQAMLKHEAAGFTTVLSVHDELLAECVNGEEMLEKFESIMAEPPSWALDCPIRVEGWHGRRYHK